MVQHNVKFCSLYSTLYITHFSNTVACFTIQVYMYIELSIFIPLYIPIFCYWTPLEVTVHVDWLGWLKKNHIRKFNKQIRISKVHVHQIFAWWCHRLPSSECIKIKLKWKHSLKFALAVVFHLMVLIIWVIIIIIIIIIIITTTVVIWYVDSNIFLWFSHRFLSATIVVNRNA